METAAGIDLRQSLLIRAVFRAREVVLGADPDTHDRPRQLLKLMTSLGWRILAENVGREVVVGAVTQPWQANVVFRGLAPAEFREFNEPDYVKIAWTLRADRVSDRTTIFRTETRVATTDATARAKFRWYWAFFSPGILLIRWLLLGQLRTAAERRAVSIRR